jgi:RNA-directed DNA polymerase
VKPFHVYEATHYRIFSIPKKNGKSRVIEAPVPELKAVQREHLVFLKHDMEVSPFAHAFQPYKNIATMAMPHVGKQWVMAIDIEDFFPSVTQEKFANHVAGHFIAKKEPPFNCHFADFEDGKGRRLPQGAPASPLLSNAYLFSFDWRLAWKCYSFNVDYTRYADDIVISGNIKESLLVLYKIVRHLLEQVYGLMVNKPKVRLMHRKGRQVVCGIVVNEKLNLRRKWRKNLRAEIFQQKGGGLRQDTKGRMAFREMVLANKKTSYSSREICKSVETFLKLQKQSEREA